MKNSIKTLFLCIVALLLVAVGCRNSETEKRIEALESKQPEAASSVEPTPVATADVRPEGPIPAIEFEQTEYDFGTIEEGKKVDFKYVFKNTGEAPLVILSATPSCGCTVPEWSKDPIPVGGTGFIQAQFDSQGKHDAQNRTITITANTWPKQTTLRFKGIVKPKPGAAAH